MAKVGRASCRGYRKKILKHAKGMRGRSKNCFSIAIQKVEKGLVYAYRDRKVNKRSFRALWITRINAEIRNFGLNYSEFMHRLKTHGLNINRKMLADLAVNNSAQFSQIVAKVAG